MFDRDNEIILGFNSQYTGCFMVCGISETPLFSDIDERIGLYFHVVSGHMCGFDILKKEFANFFLVWVRATYRLSLVFRPSLVCSKFTFSAGVQLLGLKTTLH